MALSYIVDTWILDSGDKFSSITILFYCANEIISIFENVNHFGLPLPKKFKEYLDCLLYTSGIAMLFDSSASDEERKVAAPYFYPKEKDGVVFFPSGYGSSEQHSPSLFIISQYVQWNMIIFEGFAEELGFAGIYLQHNWDDLSMHRLLCRSLSYLLSLLSTSHPNYVADRYRQTRVPLQSPQI